MAHLLVRHKVKDFGSWKRVFDAHRPARKEAGLRDLYLWHDTDEANTITLLFDAADLAKARKFASSDDLRTKMREAGVVGAPDIFFLEG